MVTTSPPQKTSKLHHLTKTSIQCIHLTNTSHQWDRKSHQNISLSHPIYPLGYYINSHSRYIIHPSSRLYPIYPLGHYINSHSIYIIHLPSSLQATPSTHLATTSTHIAYTSPLQATPSTNLATTSTHIADTSDQQHQLPI